MLTDRVLKAIWILSGNFTPIPRRLVSQLYQNYIANNYIVRRANESCLSCFGVQRRRIHGYVVSRIGHLSMILNEKWLFLCRQYYIDWYPKHERKWEGKGANQTTIIVRLSCETPLVLNHADLMALATIIASMIPETVQTTASPDPFGLDGGYYEIQFNVG